jgi:hypothetical protein
VLDAKSDAHGSGVCAPAGARSRPPDSGSWRYVAIKRRQNSMLANLQAGVADYYQRHDQWSYAAHRRIFDAHRGPKVEHTSGPVRVS